MRRFIKILSGFIILVGVLFLAIGTGLVPYSWYNKMDSVEVSPKESASREQEAQGQGTAFSNSNVRLTAGGMGVIQEGIQKPILVAPEPLDGGFRDAKCDLTATELITSLPANSWTTERLHGFEANSFTYDVVTGGWADVPAAPGGTANGSGAKVGNGGTVTVLGHVNFNFPRHNILSNYGKLHKLKPCESIFASTPEGTAKEYKVTDVYTLDATEFKNKSEFFNSQEDGSSVLYLVTCSGEKVSDAHGNYTHNLIVKAVEVTHNQGTA